MAMDCSWDKDSKQEHLAWLRNPATPVTAKTSCGELWMIWLHGICVDSPVGLTQCDTETRRDGKEVEVYCLERDRNFAMCFGVCEDEVRLVVLVACEPSTTRTIAAQRIRRW